MNESLQKNTENSTVYENRITIDDIAFSNKVKLSILRIDKIHPFISGNKWYKLKYNIQKAKKEGYDKIITFGGAYSNHIAASAAAAKEANISCIGIIRGEEHSPLNATLQFAKEQGMSFHYMDRATYREKGTPQVIEDLKNTFGDFFLIPEGGTNELAIKGTEEIVQLIPDKTDFICCPVGTGGTIAGIINSTTSKVIGFPALKGDFLKADIKKWVSTKEFEMLTDYHFGGYAKHKPELITFINEFKQKYGIPLDPIYTGKMMFGVCDLIKKGYFDEGSNIVAIHTGGLQGIKGFNKRYNNILI